MCISKINKHFPKERYKIIRTFRGALDASLTLRPHILSRCFRAASHLFPYVKKRIQVISQSSTELNPIEVAIDEMSKKVSELNQLCTMDEVDMIRLQLKVQGSVSVKVGIVQSRDAHGPWHLVPSALEISDGGCESHFSVLIPCATFSES